MLLAEPTNRFVRHRPNRNEYGRGLTQVCAAFLKLPEALAALYLRLFDHKADFRDAGCAHLVQNLAIAGPTRSGVDAEIDSSLATCSHAVHHPLGKRKRSWRNKSELCRRSLRAPVLFLPHSPWRWVIPSRLCAGWRRLPPEISRPIGCESTRLSTLCAMILGLLRYCAALGPEGRSNLSGRPLSYFGHLF